MNNGITIRHELRCGDLGRIIALHGEVYDALPGFGLRFEAYVARTIAEYVLDNDANGHMWLLERDGRLVGCTAVVLRDNGRGQIRWVVVDPTERGKGLGKKMVTDAVTYCAENDCLSIFLETTDGLVESLALYESLGFQVISNTNVDLWEGPRPLMIMEKAL